MNTSVQDPQEKNKATIILISNMATLEKTIKTYRLMSTVRAISHSKAIT